MILANENGTDNPARQAWREAVAEVAEKAKAALPQCNGRVEKALALVLAGDVEILPDGKAKIASQSNGSVTYLLVNGICECKDATRAPEGMCEHRLAYGIAKRASSLARTHLEALDTPQTAPDAPHATIPPAGDLPHPPTGTANIPSQFIVELHGKSFVTYAGLLAMAHEKGLTQLSAHFIRVDAGLALAEATAEFADGRTFMECADATPGNVNLRIRPHFPRMALTRAKSRALRDALNISMVALEELAD